MSDMDKRAFFDESFAALTGHLPMNWQRRLFLEHFSRCDIPRALDIPTGLGKTSVMAIWLVAHALASEEERKTLPRRLVYVVDRRTVVDQATTEAEKLRKALEGEAEHFSALSERARAQAILIAAELKKRLGFDETHKLPISTLRGAHVDSREWLDDPTVPAIVVGTVDMVGSRLLFSGYGVSRKMRPYHAGLLGVDALVALDEAHLVPPFAKLLRVIESESSLWPKDRAPLPGFVVLPLSATQRERPAEENGRKPFGLEEEDRHDDTASQRLNARKQLQVEPLAEKDHDRQFAEAAFALATKDTPTRVVVFCNRREKKDDGVGPSALGVAGAIVEKAKREKIDIDSPELLVGARRVHEREQVARRLQELGFTGPAKPPKTPSFLVATSAGEVGVDFDADHMVCDLASWERMAQRLGRVNRRGGEARKAQVIVFDTSGIEKDEAQKALVTATCGLLKRLEYEFGGRAGPAALQELCGRVGPQVIEKASTAEPLHPALTRALVDAWSMTSLDEHTGRPDIQPWLRGWKKDEPQTAIVWRVLLPVRIQNGSPREVSRKEINEFFEAAPPHLSEILETETWRAVEWLIARAKRVIAEVEKREQTKEVAPLGRDSIVLFVLNARDELDVDERQIGGVLTLGNLAELGTKEKDRERKAFIESLEGRTLVVSAHLGGLEGGMLRDAQDAAPSAMDTDAGWDQRPFRVTETSDLKPAVEPGWKQSHRFVHEIDEDGEATRWLIVDEWKGQAESEDSRALSRRRQTLKAHQEAVETIARGFAQTSGLPAEYVDMLGLAARWHDEGKKQLRWRLAFAVPRNSEALAKTEHFRPSLLDGYRHEFGSLFYAERNADVQQHPDFKKLASDLRDLLLHLVAAHHGSARPLISAKNCEGAAADLEVCALKATLRFERLQKRWGPWGLAWWESLLRAADQTASRQNDEFDEAKSNTQVVVAA